MGKIADVQNHRRETDFIASKILQMPFLKWFLEHECYKSSFEDNQSLPSTRCVDSQVTLGYTEGSKESCRTSIFDSGFSSFICWWFCFEDLRTLDNIYSQKEEMVEMVIFKDKEIEEMVIFKAVKSVNSSLRHGFWNQLKWEPSSCFCHLLVLWPQVL